jgi:tRNA pseudouridine38-40 synthase
LSKYKVIIAYDGTDYYGWQLQKELPTVAGTLQETFHSTFGHPITVLGVSRTDAGVHAHGQVGIFTTPRAIEPSKLLWAWNNKLPPSIKIRSLSPVALSYSPFVNISYKIYRYHFFVERPAPFVASWGLYVRSLVDKERLEEVLKLFIGTHDFRSFCTGDEREMTVRTINSIGLSYSKRYNAYRIEFRGRAFLRYMIRRIVGAALFYATHSDISLDYIRQILEQKDPHHRLPNAAPQGLTLQKIVYKKIPKTFVGDVLP